MLTQVKISPYTLSTSFDRGYLLRTDMPDWSIVRVFVDYGSNAEIERLYLEKYVFAEISQWSKQWQLLLKFVAIHIDKNNIENICSSKKQPICIFFRENKKSLQPIETLLETLEKKTHSFFYFCTHSPQETLYAPSCISKYKVSCQTYTLQNTQLTLLNEDLRTLANKIKENIKNTISTLWQTQIENIWNELEQNSLPKEEHQQRVFWETYVDVYDKNSYLQKIWDYIYGIT